MKKLLASIFVLSMVASVGVGCFASCDEDWGIMSTEEEGYSSGSYSDEDDYEYLEFNITNKCGCILKVEVFSDLLAPGSGEYNYFKTINADFSGEIVDAFEVRPDLSYQFVIHTPYGVHPITAGGAFLISQQNQAPSEVDGFVIGVN